MEEGILDLVTSFWLASSMQGPWGMGDHHGFSDRFREGRSASRLGVALARQKGHHPGYRYMMCDNPR